MAPAAKKKPKPKQGKAAVKPPAKARSAKPARAAPKAKAAKPAKTPKIAVGVLREEGRDADAFRTVLYYGVAVNPDRDQAFREAKAFLDAYYQKDFTRAGVEIWTACGPVEHCVDCMRGFIEAGVDHIAIRPIGADLDEQFRVFMAEVLPRARAAARAAR